MDYPSDSEVFSIYVNENMFPDLFSDYFEYHVYQMGLCSILSKKCIIVESELLKIDGRYCCLFYGRGKYYIYKICSGKYGRIYIGFTTKTLLGRYWQHIETTISRMDMVSSYKVLDWGDSWIELLEEREYESVLECRKLEGLYMRKYINVLVNWKKECRTNDERMDDFRDGVELRYYLEVSLTKQQEEKKIGSLSRYYYNNRNKSGVIYPKRGDEASKEKVEKIYEAMEDIRQLKYIKKYIKDPKLARDELKKKKEICAWLDNWDGTIEGLKN
jgi:hypothetical protein